MSRRPVCYAVRLGLLGIAFVAGWAAVFVGDSWWTLVVAAFMAVASARAALVVHDVAHRQGFRPAATDGGRGPSHRQCRHRLGLWRWQDKRVRR